MPVRFRVGVSAGLSAGLDGRLDLGHLRVTVVLGDSSGAVNYLFSSRNMGYHAMIIKCDQQKCIGSTCRNMHKCNAPQKHDERVLMILSTPRGDLNFFYNLCCQERARVCGFPILIDEELQ